MPACAPHDVSRAFLAVLALASAGAVEVAPAEVCVVMRDGAREFLRVFAC